MPDILSDADVFGPAAAAPNAPGVMSDADVFGSPGKPVAPAVVPPRQPRSEASIVLGGIGAGTKAVARSVADFGDMFAAIPGMAMGTAADVASRVQSFIQGEDPRAAGRIAKQVREGVTSTFSPTVLRDLTEKAIHAVAPDKKELEPSDVQNGMQLITQGLDKGGAWVEKVTKGVITADTFDSLVNEGMALGGLRGAGAMAKRMTPAERPLAGKPPVEPPTPVTDTPAGTAAMRDVKADIEASTGVTATQEARSAAKLRRQQAQDAFKSDPEYADYLRNYADGEAQLREQAAPLSAPGGLPTTGPRAERTGLRDAYEPPELPPANPPAIETGAPDALDSALAKVRDGRAFDLTPEERIRIRATRGGSQRGSGSTRDVASLGAVVAGTLGIAGALSALGPLLNQYGYTLKTLERLPQNRTEFTTKQIREQLARPDVSKAEKELVERIIEGKDKVSAKELANGFAEQGDKLRLTPKETPEYADYGLENIDRYATDTSRAPDLGDIGREEPTPAELAWAKDNAVDARTTVYRSNVLDDTNNHFDDPKYFAHTRSFDENGIRHVVEVQSDVAQHTKNLPAEEAAALRKGLEKHNELAVALDRAYMGWDRVTDTADYAKVLDKLEKAFDPDVLPDFKVRMDAELTKRLGTVPLLRNDVNLMGDVYDNIKHALANRTRSIDQSRLSLYSTAMLEAIDHETRRSDLRAREMELKLGTNAEPVQPLLKHWYKRIIREELAQAEPGKPMRFATADTVAKVEGWPDSPERRAAQMRLDNARWGALNQGDRFPEIRRNLEADAVKYAKELEQTPRFSPEHQSIYDRYKGEIERFLKNDLQGKPVTDSQGHTWIEVPPQPRGPTKMLGRASVGDMAALAAFVGGAAAMQAWSDNPSIVRDLVTGLLASAATRIRPRSIADSIRRIRDAKPLESIAGIAVDREANIRLAGLDTINVVRRVVKLVPDEKRREAIHEALDTGKTKGLSEKEHAAYSILREEYDRLGKLGLDADTLKSTRANYATHMWKMDAGLVERLLGKKGFGTSPNTPYALERAFSTMAEGEKAGLVPLSKDAAFVFATYANSLASAVENGRMLQALKTQKTAAGDLLVAKTADAPPSYITIQNPQLRGLAVHPEIASQMRFVFDNPGAAGVGSALEIIADVTKRSAVSASLFHVKALVDVLVAAIPGEAKYFAGAAAGAAAAYVGASALGDEHALREAALGGIAGFVGPRLKAYATGRNAFLDEVKKGSNSEFVTRAVKSGLVFGAEKGPLVVDDAGRRFYDAMRLVQREADRIASPVGIKAGKPIEMYIKANHWMDDVMWGRLHPAMKLEVWSKTSNILQESSMARNKADPKRRILSQAEADQIASKYTNDMFGGLNWTRIAMEAKTPLGRAVAQELLSASGRRVMRIAMFAPDWTISTARAALAAIDKDLVNPLKWGSVANGMFQPMTRGDLARQYVARSALYYLVAGDAINYSMSGHHLWENNDKVGWSFIDWGDGRRMQFSKHIMETPHWIDHPVKQAVGKLGYVPKEIANQALGTEYLSPSVGKQGNVFAGPKMKDPSATGRVAHALTGLTPIPAQGGMNDAAAWGFFGMPIYGKTPQQIEQLKRERELAQRGRR